MYAALVEWGVLKCRAERMSLFHDVNRNDSWPHPSSQIPDKVVVPPERFTRFVPDVANVMERFIRDFEKVTGITRTAVSMEDLWISKAPSNVAKKSFQETFGTVSLYIVSSCSNWDNIDPSTSSIVRASQKHNQDSWRLQKEVWTRAVRWATTSLQMVQLRLSNAWHVLNLTKK